MQARLSHAALWAICLGSAFLRLWDLDLIEFKGDEAGVIELARPLAEGRRLPLVGLMSSVGVHNPPMFIYLVAIPSALNLDARFVTGGLIGTSHVLTTLLTYRLVRPGFGPLVGLLGAALFACAPWSVLYGRKLWAQDVLPLFAVCGIWLCARFWERPRTRWVAGLPVLLSVLWQLHYSAIGVIALVGVMLAVGFRRIHWPALLAGGLLAALLFTPYLVFQTQHEFRDLHGLANIARGKRANGSPRKHEKTWTLEPVQLTAQVTTDHSLAYATGGSQRAFARSRSPASLSLARAGEYLGQALLLVGAALLLLGLSRVHARTPERIALSVWVFGYLGALLLLRLESLYPHYFIMLYPAAFVVMALPLAWLARSGHPILQGLGAALLGLLLSANLSTLHDFRRFIRTEGGTSGDYGVAYQHKADATAWLLREGLRPDTVRYEVHHLYRTLPAQPVDPARAKRLAAHGPAPSWARVARIFSRLRHRRGAKARCAGRQDFGPLVICPKARAR